LLFLFASQTLRWFALR